MTALLSLVAKEDFIIPNIPAFTFKTGDMQEQALKLMPEQ